MLPDYQKAKEKIHERLMNRFGKRSRKHTGPFSQAQTKLIYEGNRTRIERADGSVDDSPIPKFEAQLQINLREVEQMGMEEIIKQYDDAADEMGRKLSNHFYRELDRITTEAGNVVDGKGEPFSMEQFFQMLEKIQIDFTPDGRPELPTIVAGEKLAMEMKRVFSKAETNPKYKARYREIMERKRLEWRDRENSRKLVG